MTNNDGRCKRFQIIITTADISNGYIERVNGLSWRSPRQVIPNQHCLWLVTY